MSGHTGMHRIFLRVLSRIDGEAAAMQSDGRHWHLTPDKETA
jgi:hypothetical protein